MFDDKFAYLVGDLVFLLFWLILFALRKDLRREMLMMSLIVMSAGVVFQYFFWTKDWWRPETMTGTKIGIEDFLLGFTNGGIAAVLYEEVFRKRVYKVRVNNKNQRILMIFLTMPILMAMLFYSGANSFWATIISAAILGLIVLFYRSDLAASALVGGFLMAAISYVVYVVCLILFPSCIDKMWLIDQLSGVKIGGVPIEDLVFYFLVGFTCAPFYEYWQRLGLRRIARV